MKFGDGDLNDRKGKWKIEQWVAAYNMVNGEVLLRDLEPRADHIQETTKREITKDRAKWWDHPGHTIAGVDTFVSKKNFYTKAYNGSRHCEVDSHIIQALFQRLELRMRRGTAEELRRSDDMKCIPAIIILAICPATIRSGFSMPMNGVGTGRPELRIAPVAATSDCMTPLEISGTVRRLSAEYSEAQEARKLFLNAAETSSGCKEEIIASIITAMTNHLDITHDQSSNYLWREGSELLGDLKATQALDLLISHLAMNDGNYSESMAHQPALWGVIRIGSSAVPKLEAVLAHSPDPAMRWSAIYCLSFIGGRSALLALRRGARVEPDQCLSRFIDVSIRSLNNRQYKLKDTGRWSLAFSCS